MSMRALLASFAMFSVASVVGCGASHEGGEGSVDTSDDELKGRVDKCAAVRCVAGTTCVVKKGHAQCVAVVVPDPCATVRCAAGTHCESVQVQCITTPCDPIAQCVADPACTDAECGVAPMVSTQLCFDGSTAGPECGRDSFGACGWTITSCP